MSVHAHVQRLDPPATRPAAEIPLGPTRRPPGGAAATPAAAAPHANPGLLGRLVDRLLGWRDRVLADRRFQRASAAFPLTRPIALRRSRAVFDLTAGFVYTQTLTACLQLELFERLADRPRSLAELATDLALPADRLERLLEAAASLRLVERRSRARWGLGALGAPIVGNESLAAMLEHNALLYDDLRDPLRLLRGGQPTRLSSYWPYAESRDPRRLSPEQAEGYSRLMSRSQPLVAHDVVSRYPFRRHRAVLDVGGGEGTFLRILAESVPALHLTLFDLPAVIGLADGSGSDGILRVAGDFFADPLPAGSDLVTLVRILHDHEDDDVLRLLRNVHRALPAGGTVLVAEPMAGLDGAEPVGAAYFGWYLAAMGSGRARSPSELGALLREAGFRSPRLHRPRFPVQTAVLTALR